MATSNDNFPDETLIGGYNPRKRKEEVEAKLKKALDEIRKENIHLKIQQSGEVEDVSTMYLAAKMEEVDELKEEVEAYKNEARHFTKQYRTLQGHCGKLQTDLDAIDVSGRDDLRATRKKALNTIDQLTQQLAKKGHDDGKICPGCEVKD
ncbi:BAG family molecular chaperone regulator 4 [Orchesella cincta]|uniref:BAG family molecular chaperone regulator 4 n=1 Tax=Orchesella cincta TaxID=48709 RepID=A0A1D2M9U2_ORCCI|nr:BAG family molecular chaperone regulator 4 [Orchesella cincta]